MAFTPTLLEAASDTNAASATTVSTGSVSPVEGRQHWIAIMISGTAETPTVTGCGLTWAMEHSLDYPSSPTKRLELFRGTGTVSGTPDTIDMTFVTAPSAVGWVAFDAEGLDATTPDVAYVDDTSADVAVTTLTIGDLADYSSSPNDGALVVFGKNQNATNTIESGWTTLGHTGVDTPAGGLTVLYRTDPDIQNVMSWTGAAKAGGFIVRMGADAGSTGGTATQSSTYLAEINRLLSRGGRIAARLAARRRAGTSIATDLAALRAVYADLYSKHDELLVESLDIDDPITSLETDRDTLLTNAGSVGNPAPTPVALLKGLMSRSAESSNAAVEHYNFEANWSTLQPTEGGALVTSSIDDALAAGDSIRLRPFIGHQAPSWLKSQVGTVSTLTAQDASIPAKSVLMYWDPVVLEAYDDFMSKLAAAYDGTIPLIFEAMCMAVYAEPCLKQFNNATNRQVWGDAGYTNEADLVAFYGALDIMAKYWHETRVGIAYNGYQLLTASGGVSTDNARTKTIMQRHRALFGERAVLQNNSIRSSYIANPGVLYTNMMELGAPLSFQTATLERVGDLGATLQWGIDMGAHAIELPSGFGGVLTQAELDDYNTQLRANP